MSVRRSLNQRTHAIPANATWIEFERSDGNPKLWPKNTTHEIDSEGNVNFMRPAGLDESVSVLWRKTVGKFVAQKMNKPQGPEYFLKSWPEGYQMFDHNKGPSANPRHDPYLYGSTNALRFRSANEFAPHALWLLTDSSLSCINCDCKYCAKKPQREVSQQQGLSSKRASAEPPASVSRKRTRETREAPSKPPHAGVRRAPKPVRPRAASRLTGPGQWEVVEKSNDIREALGPRDLKAVRYFRKGEVVWCAIKPSILAPGGQECIVLWPGLVDVTTTKPVPQPRGATESVSVPAQHSIPAGTEAADLGSASRPSSPSLDTPSKANITWIVRQHVSYKIKLLATSHSITLSENDVLPYLAYVPPDHLMDILRDELHEALLFPAVQELDGSERKMFAFDPCAPGNYIARFKQSIAPYTLAIHIASKMARFWTPTDEWECKFRVPGAPASPVKGATPPAPSSQPPQPSLHDMITSAMSQNAIPSVSSGPSTQPENDPYRRILGTHAQTESETEPPVVTQLRYQGLWWGAERLWTDELVRLKLARAQFAPQGGEAILPPAGPSEATLKWNAEHGIIADEKLSGSGQKGLFMLLEGLFVVEVPSPDASGTFIKECRASGMLYELVDADWKEDSSATKTDGKGKERADVDLSSVPDLPRVDPLLANAEKSAHVEADPAISTQDATVNDQLSHSTASTPYPLPDPPKGYKFRPILAAGHEVVLSLSLISGRYYPCLFDHPLLQPTLQQAEASSREGPGGIYHFRQLWALAGLVPGIYQSMEPQFWKNGRHIMLKEATVEARQEFDAKREEVRGGLSGPSLTDANQPQPPASQGDVVMADGSGLASASAVKEDQVSVPPAHSALSSISVAI